MWIGFLIGIFAGSILGIFLGAIAVDGYWKRKIDHISGGLKYYWDESTYEIEPEDRINYNKKE